MSYTTKTPSMSGLSLQSAKAQAAEYRQNQQAKGQHLSHAQSLEAIAKQHGFRTWAALRVRLIDHAPNGWIPGATISGHYLGQRFLGTLHQVTQASPGWYRLSIALDQPIDVVTFDSFSNHRSRLQAVVGDKGYTKEATSNGAPVMVVDLI